MPESLHTSSDKFQLHSSEQQRQLGSVHVALLLQVQIISPNILKMVTPEPT